MPSVHGPSLAEPRTWAPMDSETDQTTPAEHMAEPPRRTIERAPFLKRQPTLRG